jgi:hypothetical protein
VTCDFDVKISVTEGSIALKKSDTPSGGVQTVTPTQLEATTITGADAHGVWFDANPGGAITVQASIGGQLDGRYFFFVQNGVVNGGFTGALTDPLMFEGTKP